MAPDVLTMRQWLHSFVPDLTGSVLVDVGCGDGEDLHLLASQRPSFAKFIGIDSRQLATEKATEIKNDSRIEFRCLDASLGLPFDDASIDVLYSINALESILDKQAFLRESARVLKPNGKVLLAHWDWDTQTFDGEDRALIRKIVQTFNDWQQAWMSDIDPWMGRRLWRTIQDSKSFAGEIQTYTLTNTEFRAPYFAWEQAHSFQALASRGMITFEEYQAFLDALLHLSDDNRFFYSLTLYAYVGHKLVNLTKEE